MTLGGTSDRVLTMQCIFLTPVGDLVGGWSVWLSSALRPAITPRTSTVDAPLVDEYYALYAIGTMSSTLCQLVLWSHMTMYLLRGSTVNEYDHDDLQ